MSEVKVGDRVRVVLEGTVGFTWAGNFELLDPTGEVRCSLHPGARHVVSVEVLPPPVETFGPGDVVRRKDSGAIYTVGKNGYYHHGSTSVVLGEGLFTSERYERVTP